MKFTNKHLPPIYGEHFIRALERDDYDPGKAWISTTALVGPALIRRLRKDYGAEIHQDVVEALWALMGQAVHYLLARGDGDDTLTEERLYATFNGMHEKKVVSGAFDLYGKEPGTGQHVLADWKFTSAWSFVFEEENGGVKPEWEAQTNVLAELLRRNNFTVDRIDILCIFKDWSKQKAMEDPKYPQLPIMVLPVHMWSPDDVTAYIEERIKIHEAHESQALDKLPICSEAERWQKGATWKVKKEGNKNAVPGGVKTDPQSAEDFATFLTEKTGVIHFVDHVPGKDVRCLDYCQVRQFCRHGKSL